MRSLPSFSIFTAALVLVGCASSPNPEDFGLHRVAIKGQEYFCGAPKLIVPPVATHLPPPNLVVSPNIVSGSPYPSSLQELCLTQAQWPQWLMLYHRFGGDWPVTPHAAQTLALR